MILIVDDDRSLRMSIGLMLKTGGFESMEASNEADALAIVRSEHPDLMILDMNLSLTTTGDDGIELLRKIRILAPDVPVILITAWGTIKLAVDGIQHGAVDFVTKPWSNRDFMAKIRKALDDSAKAKQKAAEVPTLEATERETITKAVDRCDGNLSKAAELLGITRQALYRRIEKYGIKIDYKSLVSTKKS